MWKFLGVAALLVAALPMAASAEDAAPAAMMTAQAELAYKLLVGLQPSGNLTISPASLAGALAAIDPGADAAMHVAIAKTLGYTPEQADAALDAFRAAAVELGAIAPGSGPLSFANAVFVAPGKGLPPSGFELLEAAGVEARELALGTPEGIAELNAWVAERTGNLIPQLLSQPLPAAMLAAINALYFKDSWRHAFPAEATAEGPFQLTGGGTAAVPLMYLPQTPLEVRESETFVAVSLPFKNGEYALTVVTTKGPAAALADFAPAAGWLSGEGFASADAVVTLPKFSAEHTTQLLEVVKSLGLAEGISPTAFQGFGGGLEIDMILQKTVIKVDETGAEAAAATVITMERSVAVATPPLEVVVDRPFLFSLRDEARGLVLLAGYIGQP